jgi:hypothetical protein
MSVPSSWAIRNSWSPRTMEPTLSSEASAFIIRTPGKFPKEHRLHSEHGESLKTTRVQMNFAVACRQSFTTNALFGCRYFFPPNALKESFVTSHIIPFFDSPTNIRFLRHNSGSPADAGRSISFVRQVAVVGSLYHGWVSGATYLTVRPWFRAWERL